MPALTSICERDNPTTSLEQRLKDLEIVTNYHDIALRSLEAWSTTAFLMDPDTEPAPILIKALSTYNEIRIESGPHPMGPPRRILAKALKQWLHSQLPPDGPFAKYHARSVDLLVARNTKKGDKFFASNSPTHISCASMERGIPDAHPLVRQQPNGEVLHDARHRNPSHRQTSPRSHQRQGTGSRAGKHQETVSRQLSLKSFILPLRDSGSTETAVRMSLRCPQVCATSRLERPLQCVVVILRLAARRIMLVPHEWTLSYSRGIVVVVVVVGGAVTLNNPQTLSSCCLSRDTFHHPACLTNHGHTSMEVSLRSSRVSNSKRKHRI